MWLQEKVLMSSRARAEGRGAVLLFWGQFGPYHYDRCRALAESFKDEIPVIGVEIAERSATYDWDPALEEQGCRKETLFPGLYYEETSAIKRFFRLHQCCVRNKASHIFLCHYEQPEYFLVAIILRLAGKRIYVMQASKFDDKPRSIWRELLKRLFYLPYCGALVGGRRTKDYVRFLGVPEKHQAEGYDTVSISRIRRMALGDKNKSDVPYSERHFTVVARFVEKKNLPLVLDAYRRYRREAGKSVRELVICGSGPLEGKLKAIGEGLDGVQFAGFLQTKAVAQVLGSTLALILPSTEEQWGLVVNEALAVGVPVLVSDAIGARDTLVRSAVNGYLFEPDNAEGLARLMQHIAGDEEDWRRLSDGANRFAHLGDVARFAEGVRELTGIGC